MTTFIKPNWENSNLNISATLAEFLGAPNKNKTLKVLKDELEKGYKNVVFICLDGFGINPININIETGEVSIDIGNMLGVLLWGFGADFSITINF